MDIQNLEFCEKPFAHSEYLPQIFSAIGHFPIIPIYQIIYEQTNHYFIYIQILLQLISMSGHLVTNPYYFLIPQISSVLIITWIHLFLNITTSKNFFLNPIVQFIHIISFLFCINLIGLYLTIFLNFLILFTISQITNICDLLSKRLKYFIFSLFFMSFFILALEIVFCENLQHINNLFPWHLIFDIMFWQITSNCILFVFTDLKKKIL